MHWIELRSLDPLYPSEPADAEDEDEDDEDEDEDEDEESTFVGAAGR